MEIISVQPHPRPVLWSSKEAKSRLETWLNEARYYRFPLTEIASYYQRGDTDKKCIRIPHEPFTLLEFEQAIENVVKQESLTKESLLHILNIVLPLGRFEYSYDYVQKIVNGSKHMSLRRTQYPCGYYELFCTKRKEVREIIEIKRVEKVIIDEYFLENSYWVYYMYKNCGFDTQEAFAAYHRENYQPVKFCHTFNVVNFD